MCVAVPAIAKSDKGNGNGQSNGGGNQGNGNGNQGNGNQGNGNGNGGSTSGSGGSQNNGSGNSSGSGGSQSNGGGNSSSSGGSSSGGGSQTNNGNGNGGGNGNSGGNGNGGSNSTPVACNAATDLSIAALSCSGFYSGNLLNNADTAAQVTGLAQIGFTWDGNFSALDSAGRKQNISGTQLDLESLFGTMVYGETVIGIHFGGGGANGVGNGTAFYKFDAGTDGTKILALNYPGSSGIALYSTGHAPIVPPDNPPPGDDTTVDGVPEPASWLMMVGGFGLIGGALRRRKRAIRFA